MRAVSTVLDATLFLLLVSAATATLVVPVPSQPTSDAPERTLEVVTTATATVSYVVPTAGRDEGHRASREEQRRTAEGTLAELLAAAAVTRPTVGADAATGERTHFERAVASATRATVRRVEVATQVRAHWRPYPDASVRGHVTVGPEPPASADVHAATVTVPSGLPVVETRAHEAASEAGYAGVAATVATAVVDGAFPVRRTRLALAAEPSVARPTRRRYERFARLLGVHVDGALDDRAVVQANGRLEAALQERVEADLRQRYESPSAAADAVGVGRVRLVVRTWSP